MVNYFPYDYAAAEAPPRSRSAPMSRCSRAPGRQGRKLVRIGIKGYRGPAGHPPARQPRLPDRHVGLDERAEQAAAGPEVARHAARRAGRARHRRDRHLCRAMPGPRSSRPRRATRRRIRAVIDRLGAGGSTAGAEGIRQAYALAEGQSRPEGRQPRHPGDRRRLQRRHHRPGRAQGLSSSASAARACSSPCSASGWAITTTR